MDNTYIPVSSNDTLLHLALSASPETLCGRIVVDKKTNFSASDMALKCDFCDTLSGGNAFLKYTQGSDATHHLATEHDVDLDSMAPFLLEDEESLDLLHKQAHIIQSVNQGGGDHAPGASPSSCAACGYQFLDLNNKFCPSCGSSVEGAVDSSAPARPITPPQPRQIPASKEEFEGECDMCHRTRPDIKKGFGGQFCHEHYVQMFEDGYGRDGQLVRPPIGNDPDAVLDQYRDASVKEAGNRNWTRDGIPIEDGFNLMLTTREASEVPYLDTSRVTISEKIHCPDCENDEWLSRVASCMNCGEMKCDGCMDSASFDLFMGTCKKCANTSVEEENYYLSSDQSMDYSAIQRAEALFGDEEDFDLTFLPDSEI